MIHYNGRDWTEAEMTWKNLRAHSRKQPSHVSWPGILLAFAVLFAIAYIGDHPNPAWGPYPFPFYLSSLAVGVVALYFGYFYKPNCRHCGLKEDVHQRDAAGVRRCA